MITNSARRIALTLFYCACITLAAGAAHIEKALEALKQAPPVCPETIDFIVFADSNTLEPLEQSETFRQILREANVLKPDFVFEAGDIVLGGAADGVPAQWDVFDEAIATCERPYLAVPGNHDISDAATEQIWIDRMGPTHYAFEYGNSCFIGLNSEEVGALNRISDEQVAWLREALEATRAANIFVFLHKPYFAHVGDPETAETLWNNQWSNVAEAFRGHPVRAVFAGHEHLYRDCGVRDGVHYVICGGAAAYGIKGNEDEGKFNHYLLVRVRGEDVNWSVIKPGSILPSDSVTAARIDELFQIRNRCITSEEVFVPWGKPLDQDVEVVVRNPNPGTLKSEIVWDVPEGWSVSPPTLGYEIGANGAMGMKFRVRAAGPEGARFPVPILKTNYNQTQHGPAVEVLQDLRLVPVLEAPRAKGAVAIDGALGEWGAAEFAPSLYPVGFSGTDKDDLACETGFMWDEEWLYLAVRAHDNEFHQPFAGDIVWKADNVEMFLGEWSWSLSLTNAGPEVFLYWGVGASEETVNTDVRLAVTRTGKEVIYEAAFPQALLTPLKLAPGNSVRYNALMNDLDPAGPEKDRHWLQLVPETGSPGNPRPRIKVELR